MKFIIKRTSDWFTYRAKPKLEEFKVEEHFNTLTKEFELVRVAEINTIAELLEFKVKYGETILANSYYDLPVLEIYDDYRE